MKRGFAAQFVERFTRRLFGWLKFLSPRQAAGNSNLKPHKQMSDARVPGCDSTPGRG
jgi:hypothetical protein